MSEFQQAMKVASGRLPLYVNQVKGYKAGYVGQVPSELAFVHASGRDLTEEEVVKVLRSSSRADGLRAVCGKSRLFDTLEDARAYARLRGYEPKG